MLLKLIKQHCLVTWEEPVKCKPMNIIGLCCHGYTYIEMNK